MMHRDAMTDKVVPWLPICPMRPAGGLSTTLPRLGSWVESHPPLQSCRGCDMDTDGAKDKVRRFRRRLAGLIRGGAPILEDYSVDERRAMWRPAKELQDKHVSNCRVLRSREKMLELMPRNAVCAEIGIFFGDFSQLIQQTTQPAKLHLIDLDPQAVEIARRRFAPELAGGKAEVHSGDSS